MSTLPHEVTEDQIRNALTTYGEVKRIHDEVWLHAYRFRVKTGVRLVDISQRKLIASHMKVVHQALICYAGHPTTCSEPVHQISECPHRKMTGSQTTGHDKHSWAHIVKLGIERVNNVVPNVNKKGSLSLTVEAQQDVGPQPRNLEHEGQKENEPMFVGNLVSSLPDEEAPVSIDVHNSEEISRMEEELIIVAINKHEKCPIAPIWNESITNGADVERDNEKQGKNVKTQKNER